VLTNQCLGKEDGRRTLPDGQRQIHSREILGSSIMNLAAETDDLQIGGYAAINHLQHECALELEA